MNGVLKDADWLCRGSAKANTGSNECGGIDARECGKSFTGIESTTGSLVLYWFRGNKLKIDRYVEGGALRKETTLEVIYRLKMMFQINFHISKRQGISLRELLCAEVSALLEESVRSTSTVRDPEQKLEREQPGGQPVPIHDDAKSFWWWNGVASSGRSYL